uniref:hypothetical protein n=1 Tax=Streptacidiphilus fuscans TaxID=2789292 RepID=UPI002E2A5098|nr:hypothetical protein [Streptacidiphilus fuscans]
MNRLRTVWTGTLAGLVSAGAAIAAGDLVAAFTGPAGAPVLAVGSAAIDLTPTALKDWAVAHFGTHDKTVLLSGIYGTMLVLAIVAGMLAVRVLWAGLVVFVLFAAVGVWAATSRQESLLPALAAGLVGCAVLFLVARRAHPTDARREVRPDARTEARTDARTDAHADARPDARPEGGAARGMGRRGFLLTAAAVAVAATLAETGARALTAARYNVAKARAALRLPAPLRPLAPIPASAHPDVAGLSAFTTPVGNFYRVDIV